MSDKLVLGESNGTIRLREVLGLTLLSVKRTDAKVATYLSPEEAEALGQALIRSAMIAREQRANMDAPNERCKNTHNPGHWPFTARCTLYLDGHLGKRCIDKYNNTFTAPDTDE